MATKFRGVVASAASVYIFGTHPNLNRYLVIYNKLIVCVHVNGHVSVSAKIRWWNLTIPLYGIVKLDNKGLSQVINYYVMLGVFLLIRMRRNLI